MTLTKWTSSTEVPWARDLLAALDAEPAGVPTLVERLRERYPDVTEEGVRGELRARGDVVETPTGWVNLVAAAEGTVLTHVLTAEERELGVLSADGDLDLWARLADEGLPLAGGGEVRTRWIRPGPVPSGAGAGLAGPDGWLDSFAPGQLFGLRLRAGALGIEQVEDPGTPDHQSPTLLAVSRVSSEAAAAALMAYLEEEDDVPRALLQDVVAGLVIDEPGVLAEPQLPLGRILAAAGMELEAGFVGLPGSPDVSDTKDLTTEEVACLVLAHTVFVQLTHSAEVPGGDRLRRFVDLIAVPVVGERIADRAETDPLGQSAIDSLLEVAANDEQRGHVMLLAARSAVGRGEHDDAERLLGKGLRLHPGCWLLAVDAAQYAAARGDAARADAVLRQAGAPAGDPMRHALKPLLSPPEGVVGRNRPCPCGSRRKYKVCCLRNVAHPLPLRARLAYTRVVVHAQRPGLFERAGRFAALVDREGVGLAIDLAVFEGGALRDYLATRGHLLRADERALLQAWMGTPLAAYEVSDVQARRSVTLRPLAGGHPVVLHDRLFSTDVAPLDVVLARVLPDGHGPALLGDVMRVHRMRRAALLNVLDCGAYDPERLAAFFGPHPLVKLRNRDGEDLVLCAARYEAGDDLYGPAWDRLQQHLGYDEDDDDILVLAGRQVEGEEYLLRGSVTRDGQHLTVQANSVERFDELKGMVRDAVPDAVLVGEEAVPADEALAGRRESAGETQPGSTYSVDDDGLTAAQQAELIDELMLVHEQRWVDEEIPALGGVTPRDAVARDGTALEEVEAILDDMAWMRQEQVGGMDADRIRASLGLPVRP